MPLSTRMRPRPSFTAHIAAGLSLVLLTAYTNSSHRAQAAMQNDSTLRLRADTRVVEINVIVRDSHGKPVADLTQSDFTVTDNGRPRPFTIFSVNRDTPGHAAPVSPGQKPEAQPELPPRPTLPPNVFTNIGAPPRAPDGHSTIILLDCINGWFDTFYNARQGVLGLMTKIPSDEKIAIYVVQNGDGLGLLQDYTTDRARLTAAMAQFIPRGMHPAPPGVSMDGDGMLEVPAPNGSPGKPARAKGSPRPPDASKPTPRELRPLFSSDRKPYDYRSRRWPKSSANCLDARASTGLRKAFRRDNCAT